jgi:dTDP-glucose 4,6-dehydratase
LDGNDPLSFSEALEWTVDWYLAHGQWMDAVKSGEYREWVERNYAERG